MYRTGMAFLNEWLQSPSRKPLVIRGARQVGKTWLVRQFAQENNRKLIEINLERNPEFASFFASNDPQQILLRLNSAFNESIDADTGLLFLDEIQAAPELFAKLRWFAEDMPNLPVIAAGSLLEFVLADHSFSMPVGRINYMHLEPLSFREFLHARNKGLLTYINSFEWGTDIPQAMHEQLMGLFKEYLIVGGMPAAVSAWINERSLQSVSQKHHDLFATYRDDFPKYKGRIDQKRLEEVMTPVPSYLRSKFVYSKINRDVQAASVKHALDLLCKAKICSKVMGSAANGVPLAAEIQDKYIKVIFLDVGLCSTGLGLSLDQLDDVHEIDLINKGGIAEQVVGQLLRTINPFYVEPALYYWHREEKGSNAEVDYVIQHRNKVIPIEVKAGSTGSMKSLHIFMEMKEYATAVRFNSDLPSKTDVRVQGADGNPVNYQLFSMPFYLLERVHQLVP